jgi:hypothetical protein
MHYAIIENGAIIATGRPSTLWPMVSFAETGPREDWLAENNAVQIRSDPPHDSETHYLQPCEPYLLAGVAYNREAVPIPEPTPEPQWLAFGAIVTADPAINQLLGTALTMAPAVAMSLSVGLGKAADGDSRVFLQAWGAAQSLGLVSAELAKSMAAMAAAHDLPVDFVEALQPPAEP